MIGVTTPTFVQPPASSTNPVGEKADVDALRNKLGLTNGFISVARLSNEKNSFMIEAIDG